ncbi:MAG: TonB-dependent receptor [Sphingobacteriales bacterium]|nr:MAG: TonB-dependent receptor [Sphingobacteriales bacterium]
MLGGRFTKDKKLAQITSLTTATCPANLTTSVQLKTCPLITSSFNYKDDKFNYLIGVNFRPNDDILLYGKYSTAYVSGGKVGPIEFDPETAKSAEAGIKADLFDRRLRANLAVFWAEYKDYQTAQGGNTLGQLPEFQALVPDARVRNALGTFVYPQGDIEAKGFELEVTAAPVEGIILGGGLSYTDTKFSNVPGLLKAAGNLPATAPDSDYRPTLRPKWTASAYGQYTSQPIWGEATLTARIQGNYQSKMIASPNANIQSIFPFYTESVPSYWLVNGRVALQNIEMGAFQSTLALWGKNLFDNKSISFPFNQSGLASATFIEPRRYGIDLTVEF